VFFVVEVEKLILRLARASPGVPATADSGY
jgi:hypothetical protein